MSLNGKEIQKIITLKGKEIQENEIGKYLSIKFVSVNGKDIYQMVYRMYYRICRIANFSDNLPDDITD